MLQRTARVAAFVAVSVALSAQQPPPAPPPQEPQRPTFRAGVSAVRVDVSVTGRKNQAVDDLTAADFVLEEDGVVQTIESCQFVTLTGERLAEREESLEIRSPEHAEVEAARDDVRLFALFLDDYHIDKLPQVTLPLRAGLTEFIDMLGPTDLIAIADPLTPMSALRLTRDRFTLKEAVRKFEGRQGEYFPVRSVLEEEQLQSRNVRRIRAEVTLSALAALVVKMGSLREGRKSIVFVSQGPPTFFGRSDIDIEDRMRDVFEAASRGNVTIHVVDPRGLGVEGRGGVRDTLYRLAGETGGRTVINTNNMVPGFARRRCRRERVLPAWLHAASRCGRRQVPQDQGRGEAAWRRGARAKGILGALGVGSGGERRGGEAPRGARRGRRAGGPGRLEVSTRRRHMDRA